MGEDRRVGSPGGPAVALKVENTLWRGRRTAPLDDAAGIAALTEGMGYDGLCSNETEREPSLRRRIVGSRSSPRLSR